MSLQTTWYDESAGFDPSGDELFDAPGDEDEDDDDEDDYRD